MLFATTIIFMATNLDDLVNEWFLNPQSSAERGAQLYTQNS